MQYLSHLEFWMAQYNFVTDYVLVITWPRVPYAKYWHSSDVVPEGRRPERIFFWTHFRLSLRMTTYLRMRRTAPPVYLDL